MSYDYTNLKRRMMEKGYNQSSLCAELGMNEGVFSLRINSERAFRQGEIEKICEILDIKPKDISAYFFVH